MKKRNIRKILNQKNEYEKNKYVKNPEPKNENRKKVHTKNKKRLNKVKKFCQQVRKSPYFIYTAFYRYLSDRKVRLFEYAKYILTAKFYFPVRSFDEKIYICNTCHKCLSRNEIPCQAVLNKYNLDPIPDQLTDLKELEKILPSKRIIFKKIAIMH